MAKTINVFFTDDGTRYGSVNARRYVYTPASLKRLARLVNTHPGWDVWVYDNGWLAIKNGTAAAELHDDKLPF